MGFVNTHHPPKTIIITAATAGLDGSDIVVDSTGSKLSFSIRLALEAPSVKTMAANCTITAV